MKALFISVQVQISKAPYRRFFYIERNRFWCLFLVHYISACNYQGDPDKFLNGQRIFL
jgi:hypothetical protein